MRSHEDFGNGTRFGPIEIVRNARESRFRNGNVFSLRAAASDSEDSIADCPGAGVFAKTFDFRPEAMIEKLNLRRPIYKQTTNYGHFGKKGLSWEE